MRAFRVLVLAAALAASLSAPSPARAATRVSVGLAFGGFGPRVGVAIGAPFYGPRPYARSWYGAPFPRRYAGWQPYRCGPRPYYRGWGYPGYGWR